MTNEEREKDDERQKEEEESDTIAASVVRGLFGDEGAESFKEFFGDWF